MSLNNDMLAVDLSMSTPPDQAGLQARLAGSGYVLRTLVEGTEASFGLTVVKRDHRRRGVAATMKSALLVIAAHGGCLRATTQNHRDNHAALAMNTSLGFKAQ